ncbi:MAG TPA: DNA replication/repair protein RecF [Chloroflexi bacterium]|nr:DNA replication/repair protein RecF [Chloroflexota bacterium]
MRLKHLSLTNFRNYLRLELDLPPQITLLQGGNAQGKTNLLEAIYYLSAASSPQAEADHQLINWRAWEEDLPFARLTTDIEGGSLRRLEITLLPSPQGSLRKEIKINGVKRRVADLLGLLKVVIFLPDDVGLIAGSPSPRRRYLNALISQVDRAYPRALQEYERVLIQRNYLLRRLREGGDLSQLEFWDERLVERGSRLIAARLRAVSALNDLAQEIHRHLTGGEEDLRLFYKSSLPLEGGAKSPYQLPLDMLHHPASQMVQPHLPAEEIANLFHQRLRERRRQEIERGVTLVGPHRDDLRFFIGGMDLTIYGSRGQHRTCALSLKLAQVGLVRSQTGERPILLLDDVMSELDLARREYLRASIGGEEQVIITATELAPFPPDFLRRAALFRIVEGRVEPFSVP